MYLATLNDYLKKLAGTLPAGSGAGAYGVGWFRQRTNPTAGQKNVYWRQGNTIAAPTTYLQLASDGTTGLDKTNTDFNTTGVSISQGTAGLWKHFGWRDTSVVGLYVNGVFVTPGGSAISGWSDQATEVLGGDGAGHGDLDVVFVRMFTGVPSPLSAGAALALIRNEMLSETVVRTANLFADYPLLSDILDAGGGAHHWTQNGSGIFTPSDIPEFFSLTNRSSATALDITSSVPGIHSMSLPPVPAGFTMWFKFTAAADGYVSFFANANTVAAAPRLFMSVLDDDATTELVTGDQVPGFIRVTAGHLYYVKVFADTVSYTTQTFTLEAQEPDADRVTQGLILINDDLGTNPFAENPLIVLDDTDGHVVRMIAGFASGEHGDSLATGELLISDDHRTGDLVAYDKNFSEQARATRPGTIRNIRRNGTVFYVASNASLGSFHKYAAPATLLQTWVHGLGDFRCAIAVSPDNTIAYFQQATGATGTIIKRYDLVGSAPLSDLATGPTGYGNSFDLLTLSDGSVVQIYGKSGSNTIIRRYSAAGSTIYDVDLGADDDPNHLCYDPDPLFFRAWTYPQPNGLSRFVKIRISDGAIVKDFTRPWFTGGVSEADPSDAPDFFGSESSCPFWSQMIDEDDPDPTEEPEGTDGAGHSEGSNAETSSCCDAHTPGEPGVVDAGTNPNPIGPMPPWMASCIGGGEADAVADLGAVEIW